MVLVITGGVVFLPQKRLTTSSDFPIRRYYMDRITAGLALDGGTTGNILRIQGRLRLPKDPRQPISTW